MKELIPNRTTLFERARDAIPGRRFREMARRCRGMMRPHTYLRLYREAIELPDHDIVEIGGGGGAGSVAMAWAIKETKRSARVIVVEKFEGGSRSRTGNFESNLERFEKNLRHYGVEEQVVLFPHYLSTENRDDLLALVRTERLAGLIHDADGLVHRDFQMFWERVVDGGLIVIDDVEPSIRSKSGSSGEKWYYKKLLTYCLVTRLIRWGLLEPTGYWNNTLFGRKPAGATFDRFDAAWCEDIVLQVRALCKKLDG